MSGLASCLLLAACSGESGRAFVPGAAYAETLDVTSGLGETPTVRVGEPLVLHARRTSGPWVEADLSAVASECYWAAPPPSTEPEVADNIRWEAVPAEAARFNLDIRDDRTREVRFSEPGRYVLRASSTVSCWVRSAVDSLVVQVEPAS